MKPKFNPAVAGLMLVLSGFGYTGSASAAGDPVKGQQAAAMCVACHQADGNGKNNPGAEAWPRLAGLDAEYLAKQLHDFKKGTRSNPSMTAFANMLSDHQIEDVSAYYAALPAKNADTAAQTADQAALGKRLAIRGDWDRYIPACNSCHGPDSSGVGSAFPELAGQHAGYIRQQLLAWKNGTRSNDPNNLMLAVAKRMSDQDIDAVAHWLAAQPAK